MPHHHTFAFGQVMTQKAKGIMMLSNGNCGLTHFPSILPPSDISLMASSFMQGNIQFPRFARPCPMRPRHGFVESRVVNNMDELLQLWQAARVADNGAEVILMPVFTGRLSSVAHSSGVTWGKNNDGATSGDGAMTIPCPSSRDSWQSFTNSFPDIGIESEGWVELVENNFNLVAVQVRDGPQLETNSDFIPASSVGMTIDRIVTVKDLDVTDNHPAALLRWEKYIDTLANKSGLVIALPDKTLASHFAVHGIVANIPVICSDKGLANLRVGRPLEGSASAAPLSLADIKNIVAHAEKTKALKVQMHQDWLFEALGTLHSCSIWDNQEHLIRLRATMPVVLTRFLAAAALGELRHFSSTFLSGFSDMDFRDLGTRHSVHEKMFTAEWNSIAPALKFCAGKNGFAVNAARSSSYGGPKWAKIALLGYKLHCQIEVFCKKPTVSQWGRIMKTCNIAVNLCHNGGNVLTKWIQITHLDRLAMCPCVGFLNVTAGEHCLQLPERME